MSENNGSDAVASENAENATVATQTAGVYDYLAEEQKAPEAEESAPETEDPQQTEESAEQPEAPESDGDGSDDEDPQAKNKPWKHGKQETPKWAIDRFRKYSGKVKGLEEKLTEANAEIAKLKANGGQQKELTREDFPDQESWNDYKIKVGIEEGLAAMQQSAETAAQEQNQINEARATEQQHVEAAISGELSDYHEVLKGADPTLEFDLNVLNRISQSPAGPYVKYKIAGDAAFSDQLKEMSLEERSQAIVQLHDDVIDYMMANMAPEAAPAPGQPQEPVNTQPPAAPVKKKPAAPPKAKGRSISNDMLSLSGDDYARQANGW